MSVWFKIRDFFIGFFGVLIMSSTSLAIPWISIIVLLAVMPATVYFFRVNRPYISIGILSTLLIPFLIFGACSVIFLGAH
jgi:uncharacterized membrane protein